MKFMHLDLVKHMWVFFCDDGYDFVISYDTNI